MSFEYGMRPGPSRPGPDMPGVTGPLVPGEGESWGAVARPGPPTAWPGGSPPRTLPGMVGLDSIVGGLPPASGLTKEFPDIPDDYGKGAFIDSEGYGLTDEEMAIANNVALSKYYSHMIMSNGPLILGGAALALWLILRR